MRKSLLLKKKPVKKKPDNKLSFTAFCCHPEYANQYNYKQDVEKGETFMIRDESGQAYINTKCTCSHESALAAYHKYLYDVK